MNGNQNTMVKTEPVVFEENFIMIKRRLWRLVKPLIRNLLKIKAYPIISRLCAENDGVSELVGTALKETSQNDLSPEEKLWIDKIESLRKNLNLSTTKISIMHYGAITQRVNLPSEEMYKGTAITNTVGEVCKLNSKPYFWSLFLFKLIRNFKPALCLELGTCLGVSASFQAAGIKLNGNGGKIITLEGSESLASLAENNVQSLGLDNITVVVGRFQDTLDEVLNTYQPIDYAFIDGHHDEKATLTYFQHIMPFLSKRALLIFDDISWSKGMRNAWNVIATDTRVKISFDLGQIGVCIIDSAIEEGKKFTIPLI